MQAKPHNFAQFPFSSKPSNDYNINDISLIYKTQHVNETHNTNKPFINARKAKKCSSKVWIQPLS